MTPNFFQLYGPPCGVCMWTRSGGRVTCCIAQRRTNRQITERGRAEVGVMVEPKPPSAEDQLVAALETLLDADDRWRVVPSPGCVTATHADQLGPLRGCGRKSRCPRGRMIALRLRDSMGQRWTRWPSCAGSTHSGPRAPQSTGGADPPERREMIDDFTRLVVASEPP